VAVYRAPTFGFSCIVLADVMVRIQVSQHVPFQLRGSIDSPFTIDPVVLTSLPSSSIATHYYSTSGTIGASSMSSLSSYSSELLPF
jgi:hypothetical protein